MGYAVDFVDETRCIYGCVHMYVCMYMPRSVTFHNIYVCHIVVMTVIILYYIFYSFLHQGTRSETISHTSLHQRTLERGLSFATPSKSKMSSTARRKGEKNTNDEDRKQAQYQEGYVVCVFFDTWRKKRTTLPSSYATRVRIPIVARSIVISHSSRDMTDRIFYKGYYWWNNPNVGIMRIILSVFSVAEEVLVAR